MGFKCSFTSLGAIKIFQLKQHKHIRLITDRSADMSFQTAVNATTAELLKKQEELERKAQELERRERELESHSLGPGACKRNGTKSVQNI